VTIPDPRIPDTDLSAEELEARYPDDPVEPVLTEREQLSEELATADDAREDEIVARLAAIKAEDEAKAQVFERTALLKEAIDRKNPPTDERRSEIVGRINEIDGAAAPELSTELPEGTPLPYSTDKEYGRVIAMADAEAKKDVGDVLHGRVPMSEARRARLEELAALRDDPAQHDEAVQRIHALVTASRDEIDFGAQGNPYNVRQITLADGGLRIESTSDLGMVEQVDYTKAEVDAMHPADNPFGTRPSAPLIINTQEELVAALEAAGTDSMALRRVMNANEDLYKAYRAGFDVVPSGATPSRDG
jgi:hypothetical protein